MTRDANNLIVGLDIGTSKVVALVAEVMPDGRHEIIGKGEHISDGLKRGMVVNIEATVNSIKRAVEEAELMADCKIKNVYTGIAGSHIQSVNSDAKWPVKDKEVSAQDVARVIEMARTSASQEIPAGTQILHVVPQEFIIDSQNGIREPIGMSGKILEVNVHVVAGAESAVQNILKCVRRCGLEVSELILQPMASAEAVLTQDEKNLGVVLVDIGGGTTDIAIFADGAIRYTKVLPIAGELITNDIAMALSTPTANAEEIKLRYGEAKESLVNPEEILEIAGHGGRGDKRMSRQTLAAVIEPRVQELFELVRECIKESGCEETASSGVVLTGGTALLPGIVELADDIFLTPNTRIGIPKYEGKLSDIVSNPRFSTSLGLLMEAKKQYLRGGIVKEKEGTSVWKGIQGWIKSNF